MNFFTHKKIDVTFTKGKGTFAESGTDTVKLSGLRVSAMITKAGGAFQGAVDMSVWGLTLSKMNDLATLGQQVNLDGSLLNNSVLVEAGDAENGMATVFFGTIHAAWSDFMSAPDNPFHVSAHILGYDAVKPAPPTSYRGLVDVSTVLSGMATYAGLQLDNQGVDIKFEHVYYPGAIREQMERVCKHANINFAFNDPAPNTLTIWPKGKARGDKVPLVSPESGLVGYPTFTRYGIIVTTYFNPNISFGNNVKIQSDLKPANKIWNVLTLSHVLESEVPRGQWITRFEATDLGVPRPVSQ